MNILHDLIRFFSPAVLGLAFDAAGGASSGGEAAPAGGTGAVPSDATATKPDSAAGTAQPTGQTPNGTGSTPTYSPLDIRSHLDDKGTLKPGWAKAYGLPEGYEKKFTTTESALKSLYAADKMISSQNKVAIPGPNSTQEEKNLYYKAIGRPDSPDQYKINLPKDSPIKSLDEAGLADFKKIFYEEGLTQTQVDKITAKYLENSGKIFGDVEAKFAKQRADADAGLRKEWGSNYDSQLALAQKAATELGLNGNAHPDLGNNPEFIRTMAKVGKMMGEGSAAGVRGSQASTPSPDQRIKEIYATMSQPGYDRSSKQHRELLAEQTNLFKQKSQG